VMYFAYKYYYKWMQGKTFSESFRADGKIVIVTGANCGIGKETAISLAKRGAKVILACRDVERGMAAERDVRNASSSSNVFFKKLDLSSFKSVHEFAETIMKEEAKIDILINNAGMMGGKRTITADGIEQHWAANHFGHFLLTNLLLNHIKKSPKGRIVVVSSMAQSFTILDKKSLIDNYKDNYKPMTIYAETKFGNVLFANELARKLKDTNVTVNSLHPGAIYTNIARNMDIFGTKKIVDYLLSWVGPLFFRTAKSGSQTTLYAALEPSLDNVSGEYFDDCGPGKMNPKARDPEFAKWFWNFSVEKTKL